jgi:hypothetical protein
MECIPNYIHDEAGIDVIGKEGQAGAIEKTISLEEGEVSHLIFPSVRAPVAGDTIVTPDGRTWVVVDNLASPPS